MKKAPGRRILALLLALLCLCTTGAVTAFAKYPAPKIPNEVTKDLDKRFGNGKYKTGGTFSVTVDPLDNRVDSLTYNVPYKHKYVPDNYRKKRDHIVTARGSDYAYITPQVQRKDNKQWVKAGSTRKVPVSTFKTYGVY